MSEPLPSDEPPAMAPWNLTLRFLVELGALIGLGAGGWALGGTLGLIAAIVAPLLGASAWGALNVEGDPSRSGNAPVPVPGAIRLVVEGAVVLLGATGWWVAGYPTVCIVVAVGAAVTTLASLPRVRWLLSQ